MNAPNSSLGSSVPDPSGSEPLVAPECKAQIANDKVRKLEEFKTRVGPGIATHQTKVIGSIQFDTYTILNGNGLHCLWFSTESSYA